RSRSLPEVPTVAERGFPGFEAGSWFGFFAPRGTPDEVVTTLNNAVNEIIAVPAVEAAMVKEGADPTANTPQQFSQFVQREFEKWRAVVRESGAVVE
ncbi:MAG: tripartite tricarboxylate transporter substrate-binding protein, partial [Burkholderiales bacterium]